MSDSVILQAGVAFGVSAALAVYVALQRQQTVLHALVLAMLTAFMAWTSGLVLVLVSQPGSLASRIATHVAFAGVMGIPPLWLFLSAKLAKISLVEEQPTAVLAALFTPSLLTFLAFSSDPLHGLFAAGDPAMIFTEPVLDWAGPFFWVHAGWAYFCTLAGIALCVSAARRCRRSVERRRFALVATGAAVPLLTVGITMTGVLPPDVRLTPADFAVSAILLVTAILRYEFLEPNLLPASQVISHLREALFLADRDGIVVDANPAAQRLLGESLDALRGRPLRSVVADISPDADLDAWNQSPTGEEPEVRTVVSEDERVFDVSYAQVLDGRRSIGGFVVVLDRTAQHRADRALHQSQRLESLGVLVAGIAHEINNPLAFVRTNLAHLTGLSDLVAKRLDVFASDDAAALGEMGEVILETQGGVDRISRIVDATRRLSREPQTRRERIELNEVIEGALSIAALHSNRGVEVTADLDPSTPPVFGSAGQLGQVLLNLLINAKQATAKLEHGHIHVEAIRLDAGRVSVRVHDNGPGIRAADRESVFDPFFTTKGPDEGTGLGLAIAFDIAEEHGGTLTAGTSHLGGACFELVLPTESASPGPGRSRPG